MNISDVLEQHDGREIISCTCDARVGDLATILAEKNIGALPVLRDGKIEGVFSGSDLVRQISKNGAAVMDMRAEDVMTSPAIAVSPKMSLSHAMALMGERNIRHLPVVKDDEMVGFVSIVDLVKFRSVKIESEAAAMRDYITYAGGGRV